MDQDAYHKTYHSMNERFCLFEKGVLASQCRCCQSERFYLAERIGVHCASDEGQLRCKELLELLRHHARFTLKNHSKGALPHGQAIRIQIGGLRGVHSVLKEEKPPLCIEDVYNLLKQAAETFDSLDHLPFQEVIKQVAAYKGRSRRPKS
ncbi:MAG: hypothetical protein RPU52_08340 [Candidatus Sedimenticola sp. (ex Thyasira tokunagai)]